MVSVEVDWPSEEVQTGVGSRVLRKGEVGLAVRTGGVGLAVEEVGGERPTGEGSNPEEEEGRQTGSAVGVASEEVPIKGSTSDRLAISPVGEREKEQAGERERGDLIIISRGQFRPTRGGAGETTVRRRSS